MIHRRLIIALFLGAGLTAGTSVIAGWADVFKPPKGITPIERSFKEQPPLIPHRIDRYRVNKSENQCVDCHVFHKGASVQARKAKKLSPLHYQAFTGERLDKPSPRYYFCTQCHVPQTDAEPLFENTFTKAR